MRRITAIAMFAFVVFGGTAGAEDPGVCLTEDEAELLGLINEYRADNGLPPIPWSKSLSKVGQWHVWDLMTNDPVGGSCNAHSWSAYGETAPEVYWTEVCYDGGSSYLTGCGTSRRRFPTRFTTPMDTRSPHGRGQLISLRSRLSSLEGQLGAQRRHPEPGHMGQPHRWGRWVWGC